LALRALLVLGALCLAGAARADAVLDWNELLLAAIRATRPAAPQAARQIAIVNVAAFDAANAADGRPFVAYACDGPAAARAAPDTAATAAAAAAMQALFPDLAKRTPALAARIAGRAAPQQGDEAAVALGRACAAAVLAGRAGDGADATPEPFTGGTEPGRWRPTPPGFAAGLLPGWGNVALWVAGDADVAVPPPPPPGSRPWLENFNAVKSIGSPDGASFTERQAVTARFWADEDGSDTPPGHWVAIARGIALRRPSSVVEHARLFAQLGLALADTATVVWAAKYRYASWRPVTAIRVAGTLGDPLVAGDAEWTPFLVTPPSPDYPSGHSAFAAAAARVLQAAFGGDAIDFDAIGIDPQRSRVSHHFARLSDAAEEAGLSRIYGGVSFYFSHRAGAAAGQAVAERVLAGRLRPSGK